MVDARLTAENANDQQRGFVDKLIRAGGYELNDVNRNQLVHG